MPRGRQPEIWPDEIVSALEAAFKLWRQPIQKWVARIDPDAAKEWPEPGNVSARAVRAFLVNHQFGRHEKAMVPSRTIIHRMLKRWRSRNDPFYVHRLSPRSRAADT